MIFWTDRKSTIFGIWAAPGRPGNLLQKWGAKRPIFLEGLPAARGRPNLSNRRSPVGEKIMFKNPGARTYSQSPEVQNLLFEIFCLKNSTSGPDFGRTSVGQPLNSDRKSGETPARRHYFSENLAEIKRTKLDLNPNRVQHRNT